MPPLDDGSPADHMLPTGDLPPIADAHHVAQDSQFSQVSEDMRAYLRFEAQRRGVSEQEIYEEELRYGKAIDDLGITEEFLSDAAKKSKRPDQYMAGEQHCPF